MPDHLRLSRAQLKLMIDHARANAPEEACGILAGDNEGKVLRVFLMTNAEHSNVFFLMDSREQFEVFDKMDQEELELLAIFHSHPHSEAYPSGRDRELAFYPDSLYVIISLEDKEPVSRAFRIQNGNVREAMIVVDD